MGVLQWDHLVTTLLPPRLIYSWKYVSARNCVLFEKLTRVLTGSVKEQGQILILLSIDRAGFFFFFSFKDLRKGRYMPNYPSFLASVKCRETKFMYWSEGKKTLQTWSSSAVFDNHFFFIGSCFTEVGGKLIFKCAPSLSFHTTRTSVFVVTSFDSDSHCPVVMVLC